ncbi:1,4-alpha-glucan branching protein GlgB [Methylomonas sp. MgM2]
MNDDLIKIVELRHERPFDVLGPQRTNNRREPFIIRVFIPRAAEISIFVKRPVKKCVKMDKLHPEGLFVAQVPGTENCEGLDYVLRIADANERQATVCDPYNFAVADLDADEEKSFRNGKHHRLFERCGAHVETRNSVSGVRFGVWAPHAQRVSVVGNFNAWDGRQHTMQKISPIGLWALFIPGAKPGDYYKFEIRTAADEVFLKTDPFAFRVENTPEAAAIVCNPARTHCRHDSGSQQARHSQDIAVFRLSPPNRQTALDVFNLSEPVLKNLGKQGYSHLQIPMFTDPASDMAFFFTPSLRAGSPQQFQALIDRCHRYGLGVILDVIPPFLPEVPKNLVYFDGAPLYERQEKDTEARGFYFATDQSSVKNYLLSYILFWLEIYHIDGFRIKNDDFELYRDLITACSNENPGILWLVHTPEMPLSLNKETLNCLFQRRNISNPHAILGLHRDPAKKRASIRAIRPKASCGYVYFPEQSSVFYEMERLGGENLWQAIVPYAMADKSYRLHFLQNDGRHDDLIDTYAIDVSYISDRDRKLFAEGNHYEIYRILGAHPRSYREITGVNFAVWAPNAAAISVLGDFNAWNGEGHPMKLHARSGIWELFVPELGEGEHYQFEIFPRHGAAFFKSDPYAFYAETAPATKSVVYAIDNTYQWHDDEWLRQRRRTNVWRTPITIYEVHLASWRRGADGSLMNYVRIGEKLIPYVKQMGFTHIEILPIAEHPYEPSWGYQVSNFYAPTSRLGKPEELMSLVDLCHQNGIGVLLDWVAGHFPKDAHALAKFDGSHLYEHEDPRKGEHKDWGTLIFNYGRHEAENFLIANALFWLEHYHFDGLRVDAVASMLYLNYSRKDGEWIPNIYGGNENLEAIEFLKHTNFIVHGRFPGVMMIAEESTAWAGVSRPTDAGGLGFGFKWNMGWMHDILCYLQTPPEFRQYHHHRLSFIFHYAFEENFILSLSHDEVVHLKGSLYTKMPGNEWEKFANLRLLFFFMFTHPGKKLNFMGAEFGQQREWSESSELQWPLLENDMNRRLQSYFKTLNLLYRSEAVLYEMDCRPAGFSWIDSSNDRQSIIVFMRKAKDPRIALIAVINFSAISRFNYRIGVPFPAPHTEIFNSNDAEYGGLSRSRLGNRYAIEDIPWHGQEFSLRIDKLPAFAALLLKPETPDLITSGYSNSLPGAGE